MISPGYVSIGYLNVVSGTFSLSKTWNSLFETRLPFALQGDLTNFVFCVGKAIGTLIGDAFSDIGIS